MLHRPLLLALALAASACSSPAPTGDAAAFCEMPASLWSSACTYCVAMNCCPQTTACRADTTCMSFLTCAEPCGMSDPCFIDCVFTHSSPAATALQTCVRDNCRSLCT